MRCILDEYKETVKFDQKKEMMKLVIKNKLKTPEDLLKYLIDFSQRIVKLFSVETSKSLDENVV